MAIETNSESNLEGDVAQDEIIINFLCNVASELFCSELFKTQQAQKDFLERLSRIENNQMKLFQMLGKIEERLK